MVKELQEDLEDFNEEEGAGKDEAVSAKKADAKSHDKSDENAASETEGGDGSDSESDSDIDFDRLDMEVREVNFTEMTEEEKKEAEEMGFVNAPPRFNASMAWRGAIHAPSDEPKNDPSVPKQNLELEWVYGYRCDDSRNNVWIDGNDNLVYPSAGVLVAYDVKAHTQKHFLGHNDDIVSLTQHPLEQNWFASGQVATIVKGRSCDPSVWFWNSVTNDSFQIKKAVKKSVRCLGISPDGQYLAAAGMDQSCTISVYKLDLAGQKAHKIGSKSADSLPHKVFNITWVDNTSFVSGGPSHLFHWDVNGGELKKRHVSVDKKLHVKLKAVFTSVKLSDGTLALASKGGAILFTDKAGRGVHKKAKTHKGSVYAVAAYGDNCLISGGRDKKVHVYDAHHKVKHTFTHDSSIRNITVKGNRMIVGTRHGQLFQYDNFQDANCVAVCVHTGHWDGELWALDLNKTNPNEIVTAGEDNTILAIDLNAHKVTRRGVLSTAKTKRRRRQRAATTSSQATDKCARGIAVSPDGSTIAVGSNDGFLSVYTNDSKFTRLHHVNLNAKAKMKVDVKRDNWIQAVKYSPDGKALAVGTHGCVICICDATDGYKAKGVIKKHNAAVTYLDWSKDGESLQSNCGAYELLFHDVDPNNLKHSKQNPSSSQKKDVEWDTMTCKMGWAVNGIWEADQQKGSNVNSVDCRPDLGLVVSGTDQSELHLFRYPVGDYNERKRFTGHSSHVMNVRFSIDGKRVLSAGGNDKTVLQWKVTN